MVAKTDDRYEILPYTTGATQITPEIDGKQYAWGRQGAFHVKDGGVARALEQKYEGQMITMKVSSPDVHDRGHRYFFGGWPEMPWKRKVRNGEEKKEEPQQEPEAALKGRDETHRV